MDDFLNGNNENFTPPSTKNAKENEMHTETQPESEPNFIQTPPANVTDTENANHYFASQDSADFQTESQIFTQNEETYSQHSTHEYTPPSQGEYTLYQDEVTQPPEEEYIAPVQNGYTFPTTEQTPTTQQENNETAEYHYTTEQTYQTPPYQNQNYGYGNYPYSPQNTAPQNYNTNHYQNQAYDSYPQKQPTEYSPQKGSYYYNANNTAEQNFTELPKKKSKTGLITFASLIAVCLIVSIIALTYTLKPSDQKNGTADNNTQTTTSSSAITVEKTPTNDSSASDVLKEYSKTADVAEAVTPSVVAITISRNQYGGVSAGSGFIVTTSGYIVTNYHVVEIASQNSPNISITVMLDNGEEYDGKYIAGDSKNDIAVIKIEAENLTAAKIGDSDQLKRADFVLAIGNPLGKGLEGSVSFGIVSATGRSQINETSIPYIQTDATINPGNSGGPLVNMYGQVVGINTAKVVLDGYEGLGFSIPMSFAQNIINELIATGKAPDYAFIGIKYSPIDEDTAKSTNLPVGLQIEQIYSQSKMDISAVQIGDIITEVEGKKITSQSDLSAILLQKKPGDTITAKMFRPNYGQGEEYITTITLISSNDIPQETTSNY